MAIDGKNLQTTINCQSGGSTRLTIAATNVVQGGDIPCRYCRLQSATGNDVVRVRIGSTCTSITGVALPAYSTLTPYSVCNVNQIYLYGTSGNVVDIEYFL